MWSSLLELLPQGVMVVSRSLRLIYWNSKAKELCQAQMGVDLATATVPDSISEACYRLIRDSAPNSASLFIRDERSGNVSLRISARWLASASMPQPRSTGDPLSLAQQSIGTPNGFSVDQSFIVVFLENCDEVMEQEMRIQQKKYDLTEREAEIWMLLRKEYTYQDIAKMLQISLNTVKTHVKNIYAKRRSYQGEEKILVL
jgi:DNA-binding CsgD family transcriptional regulator